MTIQAVVTHSPFVVRRRTAGDSFDLIARQETMSQTLLIPGLSRLNPNKLFAQGQPGSWADPYDLTRMWVDDAGTTPMTLANLGTGIGRVITKGNAITLTQANAADRPVWGRHPVSGIVNLLERTEEFDNAYWTKSSSSITANNGAAPDGTLTADLLTLTSDAGRLERVVTLEDSTNYTLSSYVKPVNVTGNITGLVAFNKANTVCSCLFNFLTLTVTPINATGTITALDDGWYRCTMTFNSATGATSPSIRPLSNAASAGGFQNGNTALVWGAMLRVGTTAGTYQRVTNRFDVTEVGSPSLYYFSGNGVNQSWSSASTLNMTAVNRVTVWAAVNKTAAHDGVILETSANSNNNDGAILLSTALATPQIFWRTRGTASSNITVNASANQMLAIVGQSIISPASLSLDVNETIATSATTMGTGNLGNHTLHVFRRSGSSLPFNGRNYGWILAGGSYDSRTVQRFQDWLPKPRRLITA